MYSFSLADGFFATNATWETHTQLHSKRLLEGFPGQQYGDSQAEALFSVLHRSPSVGFRSVDSDRCRDQPASGGGRARTLVMDGMGSEIPSFVPKLSPQGDEMRETKQMGRIRHFLLYFICNKK